MLEKKRKQSGVETVSSSNSFSCIFFDDGIDYLRLFVAEKLLSGCGTV